MIKKLCNFLYRKIELNRKFKAHMKAFSDANPNIECLWDKDSVARAKMLRKLKQARDATVRSKDGSPMFKRERADAGARVLAMYDKLSVTPDFVCGDRAFDESESVKRELILDKLCTIDSNEIAMFQLYHKMYSAPPTNRVELRDKIEDAYKRMVKNPPIATATGPALKDLIGDRPIKRNPVAGLPLKLYPVHPDDCISLDDLRKELDLDG
jgi:hypothetical protein